MSLASVDFLATIVSSPAAGYVHSFDRLTINDASGSREAALFFFAVPVSVADEFAARLPFFPFPLISIDGFGRRKVVGQILPGTTVRQTYRIAL